MRPANVVEWLESLRIANGPEADFAAEILDTWFSEDDIDTLAEVKEARAAADKAEASLAAIEKAINGGRMVREFVTTGHAKTGKELAVFFDQAEKWDGQVEAVRALAQEAGLIRPGDETTDIVPLLAMFLPVGE